MYTKMYKIIFLNIFKNSNFYLDRNNPKSFVLKVKPRNHSEYSTFLKIEFPKKTISEKIL